MKKLIAFGAALSIAGMATAAGDLVEIDLAGIQNWDLAGDPSNTTMDVDIAAALGLPSGTAVVVNGVGWDVNLTPFGASWYSEAVIGIGDNAGDNSITIAPGSADSFSGDGITVNYSSDGVIKLSDVGIPDLDLTDGVLGIEFFESFDDVADAVDSQYESGSVLTIQVVPAPGAMALIGLAGFAARRRRRG